MNDINAVLPNIKLFFNIEHPNLEDCYALGYESALEEVAESQNPFNSGTKENDAWLDGWWAGFYGEQPLYGELAMESDDDLLAANDDMYQSHKKSFLSTFVEISSVVAISTVLGYQLIDLVA